MAITAWVVLEIVRAFAWGPNHATAEQRAFQSRAELLQVWTADGGTEANLPAVDFEKETLVAVFLGRKNSGGHSVKIEKLVTSKEKSDVVVIYRAKAPDGVATAAITHPSHAVVIAKTKGPFHFVSADSEEARQLEGMLKK